MVENTPHTPPRQMRIPDGEWLPFDAAAKAQGQTRAGVVRELIRWYLRRPGAKLPVRPEAGPWSAPAAGQEETTAGS
ncbi:hypothetical protein ABZT07_20660 [Streptomyces sp. NPDC005317]|uniref:hypothetical protein n=1 Tax=Streptomyces sp. NPDC005317 TaxID=3156876 RepID=UPI0033A233AF